MDMNVIPDWASHYPSAEKIHAIVQGQRAFSLRGHAKSTAFRKEQLRTLRGVLKANERSLWEAIDLDMGKSEFETYLTELALVYHEIDEAISNLDRWSRPRRVRTGLVNFLGSSRIIPEPFGTTLVIGAWNYPYQLTLAPMVAALAAGNTCVVKPSELPAHTSRTLARILNGAFAPQYLHVVEGGIEQTQALLACKFDKIFFTGSTQVGRIVAKAAAEHLTPITLELGGKSPCIVMADADINMAAKRISWGKYLNAGQTCIAPDYALVERPVYEAFLQAMARQVAPAAGADPQQSESFIRIINTRNVDRLAKLIDPNKVYFGGEVDRQARHVAPTLMRDVSWDDPVMAEEIFGPVLPIIPFDNLQETIDRIKARPKPLALYLFTRNEDVQDQVLREVSFGGGCINDVIMHLTSTELPFGGVGDSGMGSYHSEAGFRTFSHYKGVLSKPFWFEPPVRHPPYTSTKLSVLRWIFG